jgi:tetratricopeptide (TPR) repeat protein
MNGRQFKQSNLPLEQLTTVHKKQGDLYITEGDYVSAAGQYSHALNYFLFNNNPEITLPELYLARSRAYLATPRYAHARCDIYTAMSNKPTIATLETCYIILRELHFLEHNVAQVAEEKAAQDFKTLQPEIYPSLVNSGIAQAITTTTQESPSFFKRLTLAIASKKTKTHSILQAGMELTEANPSATYSLQKTYSQPLHR